MRREDLRQFDIFSAEVVSSTPENLTYIILGLGKYFFPVNLDYKQNLAMFCGMRKPLGLKVRF